MPVYFVPKYFNIYISVNRHILLDILWFWRFSNVYKKIKNTAPKIVRYLYRNNLYTYMDYVYNFWEIEKIWSALNEIKIKKKTKIFKIA